MRKLAERSASASLANVAMLLESYLRAGGGQYATVRVPMAAVQIQRVISVRNHARAKAAQALQSAKMIPLIMLGVLVMMASDPATAESFPHRTVQIVIAIAMGVMLLGFSANAQGDPEGSLDGIPKLSHLPAGRHLVRRAHQPASWEVVDHHAAARISKAGAAAQKKTTRAEEQVGGLWNASSGILPVGDPL